MGGQTVRHEGLGGDHEEEIDSHEQHIGVGLVERGPRPSPATAVAGEVRDRVERGHLATGNRLATGTDVGGLQ